MNRVVLIASWIVLLVAVALGVIPLIPPSPPAELDAVEFSVTRAFDHIERISQEPHPMGSLANQRVRADIVAQLEMLGLEPEVQTVEVMDYFGEPGNSVEIGNVVARIPGTAPTTAVAVVGHYDTNPTTPGANDNGSAVAILLEVARAILADQPLHNDVILVFTDGEEPAPRFGSSAFIMEHPWAGDIDFVINLETIGSGGQSTISGMNGPGRWVIDQYLKAVPNPAAFSFLTALVELIGGSNTDFATFRDEGIAGVEFVYLRGSPIYHTPADTPDRVSLRSLQQHGANTLALTRHIGNLEPGQPSEDANAVFFNLGRFNVVRYPTTWALPLALVTGVVPAIAGWRQKAWREILRSVAATLVTILVSAVVAVGVWTVLANQRDAMSVLESYLYLGGLFLLTAGIVIAVARLIRRQIGEGPNATGVLIVWWALGLLTAIVAPGMGYFFMWPALAGGITLLWWSSSFANRWWRPILSMLVVGIAFLLSIPAIEIFYQFAQPRPGNPDSELIPFIAIPIVLFALLVELLRVFWVGSTKRLTPVHETPTLNE